jgi:hypothetical protein
MSEPAPDVSATVEYTMDSWRMNRVPWALWACAGGLAVVLYTGWSPKSRNAPALAFLYIALLGLAFAGWGLTTLYERSMGSFFKALPVVLLIAFVVVAIIGIFGTVGRTHGPGRMWWSQLVNPPFDVFGWMLMYLGAGWIAVAIYRHRVPGRPIVELTPAGVMYHRPWLRDVFIPWQQVLSVGHLKVESIASVLTNPKAIAVTVTTDFHAQHIAPKLSFFAPPGSEGLFVPIGGKMQFLLNSRDVAVGPERYRVPVEARWKAFRDRPMAVPQIGGPPPRRIVYGRWSFQGSWRQTAWFVAPLIAIVAMALHAGFWPR